MDIDQTVADLVQHGGGLLFHNTLPRIVELFETEADTLALCINFDDGNFNFLSLLNFFRMFDTCPAEVSNMDKTFDTGLYFNKCTEF